MDIHKKNTHAVVKTKQGEVIKEDEIKTKEQKIKQFYEDVEEEFEVAMEATGKSLNF